jgi:hypothetical protein
MFTQNLDWHKQFPHFKPEEFFSPEGLRLFYSGIIPCDLGILYELERLRTNLNKEGDRLRGLIPHGEEVKLYINHGKEDLRGFVTPQEWYIRRKKSPGQKFSFHLWCAADVSSNLQPYEVFKAAKRLNFGGVIKYDWGVHLDLRRGPRYVEERR